MSLVNFGMTVSHCSVLRYPKTPLSDGHDRELHCFRVSEIRRDFGHTGIYFLKNGTNQMHGKVIYNYTYTTMALAKYGVPTGKGRLLVKISSTLWTLPLCHQRGCYDLAVRDRGKGVIVCCYLKFRRNLWKYDKRAAEIMQESVEHADVAVRRIGRSTEP